MLARRLWTWFFFVFATFANLRCVTTDPEVRLYPPDDGRPREDYIAEGSQAMVVTAHPLASEAGAQMLRKGGNAADALVAASFAVSVLRPQSTGIGGGGFALYFDQKQGQTKVFDFRERAPEKATRSMFLDERGDPKPFVYNGVKIPDASVNGHLSVGIPGLVAGILDIHQRYGTLPLTEVMAPAIKLADEGFPVYQSLTEEIIERQDVLRHFPDSRDLFLPNGRPLQKGELLVQKDLAQTLWLIATHGKDGFYKGEVAKKLVAEMKHGGIMTQKDLDDYLVKERTPVATDYRGYRVVSMPPPSSGGTHIVQILNMLRNDDLKALGHNSVASVHLLSEAMRRAYADRAKYLGDPDFVQIPLAGLISKDYAASLRKTILPQRATPSSEIGPGNPSRYESPSTTHISVVDSHGNATSSTQTINNTFGSCVVAHGTGVVLNDEMDDFSIKPGVPNIFGLVGGEANAVAARKTMLSSQSPTLVFSPSNEVEMVVGSPGGSRIITATLQTIINYVDHKMPLPDAVHAYRVHHQWLPDEIRIEEKGLQPAVVQGLNKLGHIVREYEGSIGDVQAIARTENGWIGVSDTRSDGKPAGF